MSEKFRLDRKIGFQNTFYTKCINVIIDSIGPSIILRSIFKFQPNPSWAKNVLYFSLPPSGGFDCCPFYGSGSAVVYTLFVVVINPYKTDIFLCDIGRQ